MSSIRDVFQAGVWWSVHILVAIAAVVEADVSYADDGAKPFTIGSILILSGEGAATGTASQRGIDMAIETINARGGVLGRQWTVAHQDDQGDPKRTISAFRELTEVQKVRFIIGPTWSHVAIPIIPMAKRTRTLMISPSLGVASFNEAHEYLFNTWPHDSLLSRKLAEYVFDRGHRDIALIGAEHIWVKEQTEAFSSRFEELGGRIVYLAEPLPGTSDLRLQAARIKHIKKVDALVSTTDGVIIGSLLAKALKELGVALPIYSITLDQQAIDAAQGGFEGMEFLTFLTPTGEFEKSYQQRYGTPVDIGADSAYDAVMLLADAVARAGSDDPDAVAQALASVKQYQGASGVLHADGKRGFEKPYALRRVVNGVPQ
jgi:branched-chain amino acid transport system substrate-binding protein